MVKDMVHVLNCKERFSLRYQLLKSALTKDKLKVNSSVWWRLDVLHTVWYVMRANDLHNHVRNFV